MYFITSLSLDGSMRCVGYVKSLDEAIKIVENNMCDLYEEGCYPYIAIENVPEGLYKYDLAPIFFEYDERVDKYKRIDHRPYFIGPNEVGFGIG